MDDVGVIGSDNLQFGRPLKWLAQGMRSVFLPDSFKALEMGGAWNLGGVAIVTAIWLVVGLVACCLTFRWIRKDS